MDAPTIDVAQLGKDDPTPCEYEAFGDHHDGAGGTSFPSLKEIAREHGLILMEMLHACGCIAASILCLVSIKHQVEEDYLDGIMTPFMVMVIGGGLVPYCLLRLLQAGLYVVSLKKPWEPMGYYIGCLGFYLQGLGIALLSFSAFFIVIVIVIGPLTMPLLLVMWLLAIAVGAIPVVLMHFLPSKARGKRSTMFINVLWKSRSSLHWTLLIFPILEMPFDVMIALATGLVPIYWVIDVSSLVLSGINHMSLLALLVYVKTYECLGGEPGGMHGRLIQSCRTVHVLSGLLLAGLQTTVAVNILSFVFVGSLQDNMDENMVPYGLAYLVVGVLGLISILARCIEAKSPPNDGGGENIKVEKESCSVYEC